ncbi:MAG: SUMF1/EgtB/PvdO family nonheme iron enzyme, partial [Candidatus Brocadiae bacterium]|nr:SUMF1/EgtB/PvdO family nonheme iron enzyme [Candidatus Brocadiia bacterium]
GLYDMHGNMLEWCRDWYEARYYLTSLVQDPGGPETGTYRALRGGSWSDGPEQLHSAYRKAARPESIRPTYGFRVCFEVIADYAERPTPGAALRVSGP